MQQAELVPLNQLRPGLPVHLVAVVERAMDRDPERRFHTGTEMAAAPAAANTRGANPRRREGAAGLGRITREPCVQAGGLAVPVGGAEEATR